MRGHCILDSHVRLNLQQPVCFWPKTMISSVDLRVHAKELTLDRRALLQE